VAILSLDETESLEIDIVSPFDALHLFAGMRSPSGVV
jgi:hypothetical protein